MNKDINVEITRIVFESLMKSMEPIVPWSKIRALVDTDIDADNICKNISIKMGVKITYRGSVIEYQVEN